MTTSCSRRTCRAQADPEAANRRCSEHRWCHVCDGLEASKGDRCESCYGYWRRTGTERSARFPRLADRQQDLNERHALRKIPG